MCFSTKNAASEVLKIIIVRVSIINITMICNILVSVILVAAPFKALAMLGAAPGHDHGRRDLANAEGHPRTLGVSSVCVTSSLILGLYISEPYL